MIIRVLFIYLFGISYSLFCQNRQIDSLQVLLKKDAEDSNKVIHLNQLFNHYFLSNQYVNCLELNDDAINLAQKIAVPPGFSLISVTFASSSHGPCAFATTARVC